MAINNLLTKFRGSNDVPVRRLQWEPQNGFQSEMNRLFEDFFSDFSLAPRWGAHSNQMGTFSPGVDLSETDDDVIVTAELPGMDKGDVRVEIDGSALVISGEKKDEREDKNRNWHYSEKSYGCFRRDIQLPVAVMDDKAKASFKKGVLTVKIPKKEEAKRKIVDIAVE